MMSGILDVACYLFDFYNLLHIDTFRNWLAILQRACYVASTCALTNLVVHIIAQ